MADEKKKFSLGGIDNAAEEKGSGIKALWQFLKFVVVSGLVSIIQFGLAVLLPLIFDKFKMPELTGFLAHIFTADSVAPDKFAIYAPNGIVTWGYVLPFLLSNLIANIYGFYQNKKTTFKSDAPWYSFAAYIVLLLALILFATWLQAIIVGALTKIDPSAYTGFLARLTKIVSQDSVARLLASMAAGFLQMVVLFPMEKFVLLKEKKPAEGEEAVAE